LSSSNHKFMYIYQRWCHIAMVSLNIVLKNFWWLGFQTVTINTIIYLLAD
jgi:hypothetical protein